jgi:ADP-heptose:LPS heptosyltransferase
VNIAAFSFKRVGDSLLATPALRALASGGHKIAVICEPQTARVFAGNPHLSKIVTVPRSCSFGALLRTVRHMKPDATVDFLANPRTAWVSRLSGAETRCGIGYGIRRLLYNRVVPVQNRAEPRYSALHKLELAELFDATSDLALDFVLTEQDRAAADLYWQTRQLAGQRVVALVINSRRIYKRWPVARFAEVIRWIRDVGNAYPLVLQTPGDEERVTLLRKELVNERYDVLDVSDLGLLAAILARAHLFFGNDGGAKHLAVALGTPTLTLFGNEPWEYWTPPNDPRHQVIVADLRARFERHTLESVTVEQVLEALRLKRNSLEK